MILTNQKPFESFIILICLLLVSGCSEPAPDNDEVQAIIQSKLGIYSVEEIDCAAFANNTQEGSGRVSCSGVAELDESLYTPLSEQAIIAQIAATGMSSESARRLFSFSGQADVVSISASAGSTTNFSSECNYSGVADGWSITCDVSHQSLDGRPIDSFQAPVFVTGSEDHSAYLSRLKSEYEAKVQDYRAFVAPLEKFFAPGRVLELYRPQQSDIPILVADIGTALSWSTQTSRTSGLSTDFSIPNQVGEENNFRVQLKYRVIGENYVRSKNQNFCGSPRGEPRDDVLIEGLTYVRNRDQDVRGPYGAYIEMSDRDGIRKNEFSCGINLSWNGTHFVYRNGYYELRSRSR